MTDKTDTNVFSTRGNATTATIDIEMLSFTELNSLAGMVVDSMRRRRCLAGLVGLLRPEEREEMLTGGAIRSDYERIFARLNRDGSPLNEGERALVESNQMVPAIKSLRERIGFGLIEAKGHCDDWRVLARAHQLECIRVALAGITRLRIDVTGNVPPWSVKEDSGVRHHPGCDVELFESAQSACGCDEGGKK